MLFGRHYQPHDTVAFTPVVGLTSTEREGRVSGFNESRSKDGAVLQHSDFDQRWTDHWIALTFGFDAEFLFTSHLSIVSELRFHEYPPIDVPSGLITRPRVAVRWRF
jgi:hypothetical protein